MKIKKTPLDGVFIIKPSPNIDDRGFFQKYFVKVFKEKKLKIQSYK